MATIRKFLDLSTCHLPEHLMTALNSFEGVVAYEHKYGALLWVPDDPKESDCLENPIPAEILAVQLYARSLGCDYVLLDQDGDRNPDLPRWDW